MKLEIIKSIEFKYLTEDIINNLNKQIDEFEKKYGTIDFNFFHHHISYKMFEDEYYKTNEYIPQIRIHGILDDDIIFKYNKVFNNFSDCVKYSKEMYKYLKFRMLNYEINNL